MKTTFFFLFFKIFPKNLLIKGEFLSKRIVSINCSRLFYKDLYFFMVVGIFILIIFAFSLFYRYNHRMCSDELKSICNSPPKSTLSVACDSPTSSTPSGLNWKKALQSLDFKEVEFSSDFPILLIINQTFKIRMPDTYSSNLLSLSL